METRGVVPVAVWQGACIAAAGLASAQGSLAEVAARGTPHAPTPSPFELKGRRDRRGPALERRALHVDEALAGAARWNALARLALAECLQGRTPAASVPLVVASCNGAATGFDPDAWREAFDTRRLLDGTPWAGLATPVVSASCASGLHALALAELEIAAGVPEVIVLAVDILSQGSQQNFESLRVLADALEIPWQPASSGFLPGEAAVALRLVPSAGAPPDALRFYGPNLSLDLPGHDGLAHVLHGSARACDLLLGQGTGPASVDAEELRALRGFSHEVPLATPLHAFGHTLGASALLSVALLTRGAAITLPAERASDGRPLARRIPRGADAVIACRALGGACASLSTAPLPLCAAVRRPAAPPGPVSSPALRTLIQSAQQECPARAPAALVVRLDEPFAPPARAQIGGRILPSAVLELTPGFAALAIARSWGFVGPALCLVGAGPSLDENPPDSRATHDRLPAPSTYVARIERRGDAHQVRWHWRNPAF